jgi:hypothetical protein
MDEGRAEGAAAAQENFLNLCHLVQVDAAVSAAYAWGGSSVGNEENVRELLALNALRSTPVSPTVVE